MLWKVSTMRVDGREVAMRDVKSSDPEYLQECSDCGKKARFIICQLDIIVDNEDENYAYKSHVSAYCGDCEVG